MNVYDCANELAKALRESHEFTLLKEEKAKLATDKTSQDLVNDFLKLSQEIEILKYQKKEVAAEKTEQLNKLTGVLNLNPSAVAYLNAFMRFQMMMQDVTKSITDVVKEVTD
jgi:cell fate (sporulation/competence/biofilm development) regulator YlbF (YheA/YmcA/DUF963 family)